MVSGKEIKMAFHQILLVKDMKFKQTDNTRSFSVQEPDRGEETLDLKKVKLVVGFNSIFLLGSYKMGIK